MQDVVLGAGATRAGSSEHDRDRLAGGALVVGGRVLPRAAGQRVGAPPPAQHVVAVAAVDRVVAVAAVDHVVPGAQHEALRSVGAQHDVGARTGDHGLDRAQRVERPCGTARAREEVDEHSPGLERVADRVAAGAAVDHVGPAATIERVVALTAEQLVDVGVADEQIVALAAFDLLDARHPRQTVDAHLAAGGQHEVARPADALVAHAIERSRTPADSRGRGRRLEQIVAVAAGQRVRPDQRVVAGAAVDGQRRRLRLDVVVAAGRLQRAGYRRRVDDVAIGARVAGTGIVLDLGDVAGDRHRVGAATGEDAQQRDALEGERRAGDVDRVAVGVADELHQRRRDTADVDLQDLLDAQLDRQRAGRAGRRQARSVLCAARADDRRRRGAEAHVAAIAHDADRDRRAAERGRHRDLAGADRQRVRRRDRDLRRGRRRKRRHTGGDERERRREPEPEAARAMQCPPAQAQHAVAFASAGDSARVRQIGTLRLRIVSLNERPIALGAVTVTSITVP